jgi:RNA polymerase sigma-70 factor, ECF subfamily
MELPVTVTRMAPEREHVLVEQARADGSAFGELYDFYLPRVYGFIYRRVQERSVAEDLTATTFERALQAVRRRDFRNESFGGWLYRVASNAVVDHARHGRRLVPLADDGLPQSAGRIAGSPAEAPAEAFAAALDRDEVRRALWLIPETHRRVLVLKFFDDLDIDELCAVLGCSRPALAVKVHRALRALRGAIAEGTTDAA